MTEPSRFVSPPVAPDTAAAAGGEMGRVDLWVTERCNQTCVFCYLYSSDVNLDVNDSQVAAVEEVLRAGRARGYTEVDFSGGEPTLNKAFPEMLVRARALGYEKLKVMSNGLRFANPRFAEQCGEAGLTNVAISIHGSNPELYTEVHGTPGGFEKMLTAIRNLQTLAPGVEIEMNTVVNRLNVHALSDLVRLADRLMIPRVHVQLMIPNSDGSDTLFPGHDVALAAIKAAIDMPRRTRLNVAFIEPCLMGGYEKYVSRFDFTTAFFTNDAPGLVGWQRSLLAAKKVMPQCHGCPCWAECRGFWTGPSLEGDLAQTVAASVVPAAPLPEPRHMPRPAAAAARGALEGPGGQPWSR